jgi:hypothetical protein
MPRPICWPIDAMNRKHILAAISTIALAGALFYFYGGGPNACRPASVAETIASECGRGQERIQRHERRHPRAPAFVAHLSSMSAGGLCSRGSFKPVCAQACASFCRLGASAADRLEFAFNGDIDADCRFARRPILGQGSIDFSFYG